MHLSHLPRERFAHLPTPLEFCPNLTKHFGGPNIYIKRDDCNGLAGGGNKTRKLEFLMGEAQAAGADTIITQGAIQSNHARQTAAIAAKMGKSCHILLEDRTGRGDEEFYHNGNVLLTQLTGATVERYPGGTAMDLAMEKKAEQLREQGYKPYVIPGGGSNATGAVGYAQAAFELIGQANDRQLTVDHIVHATGSSGTQAGLVAGLKAMNADVPVLGISVRAHAAAQQDKVHDLANRVLEKLRVQDTVPKESVLVDDRFVGEGYGIPDQRTIEAIQLFAEKEAIFLDPVYTGKGAAGLIQNIKEQKFAKGSNVVFVHTGGSQALPGYRPSFDLPQIVDRV